MKTLLIALIALLSAQSFADSVCSNDAAVALANKKQAMEQAAKTNALWLASSNGNDIFSNALVMTNLKDWSMAEINHESMLRDQIGDYLFSINNDGRRGSGFADYHTRDGKVCSFKTFSASDVGVDLVAGSEDKGSLEISVRSVTGVHHGFTVTKFKFQAPVVAKKVDRGTYSFYDLEGVNYPLLVGKTVTECDLPLSDDSAQDCKDANN